MKTRISTLLAFLTVLIFLSSCSTTKDVASNNGIVKRKYRKGYYVQLPQLFNKQSHVLSAFPKEENGINPESSNQEIQLTASVEKDPPVVNVKNRIVSKPGSKISETIKSVKHLYEPDITDFTVLRKEYKNVKKEFRKNFTHADDEEKRKGLGFSITSFVTGLVGLLVAGIILGLVAIIFGAIALAKNKKGKVLAILGIVLGVVDVIGALIYISAL